MQPFPRYDLGDSVRLRPDPCPCGNPLPAVRVQGRAGDVLTFPTERGEQVSLAPLTFGTLLDRTPGVDRFQIVRTEPTGCGCGCGWPAVPTRTGCGPPRTAS
ncbi:MAG TPA: hypothetical protein VGX25_33065 [Actinophytocola sp.]|uniref:hypothetical protein n=1 Tax=Actinophytocola sp. TaxID=1872138 RepID=UPI002DDD68A2|nr:hypothetical protein [Actinophytocola sp.]HEV2784242.1 hypothetical protein [Actinophytocola sp.]